MNFLQFLKENFELNTAHIVLQKIVDMIDNGHIEYSSKKIDINLGKLIKDSTYYDFHIIIRKSKTTDVKLGKNKLGDDLCIVIDTDYLPQRQNIDKLFSKHEVVTGFEREFSKYLKNYHVKSEHENKTQHETSKEVNTNKSFENNFKDLKNKINEKLKEYKSAKKELESKQAKSALHSHKATFDAALAHLKKDMIGTTVKEFTSKMLKLADSKFLEHIDNDSKKKLLNRLKGYYEHYFL